MTCITIINYGAWAMCALIAVYLINDFLKTEKDRKAGKR